MAPSLLSRNRRVLLSIVMVALFTSISHNFDAMRRVNAYWDEEAASQLTMNEGQPTVEENRKTTVAYAVTVTDFTLRTDKQSDTKLIDRAAVLHHSIKLAMQQSRRYDYEMYAFVHPDAMEAQPLLERLGYRVQVRETPFTVTAIPNFELVDGQRIGCCGAKEYLKLYAYLLLDYPVVVHLDLDTAVLRPMDDVFDFMALSSHTTTTRRKLSAEQMESFARKSTMWMHKHKKFNVSLSHSSETILKTPEHINFLFTRDYNMVDPLDKHPYQIGVQGGFLVLRPNQRDFDRMVNIIQTGGDFQDAQWGGNELGYGGYYGAATIQGLASYYYDYHENATRSIELNRCHYNTMVDTPKQFIQEYQKELCTTTEDKCEDCRNTKLEDIYTTHFTVCGKPEQICGDGQHPERLCAQLFQEWHKIRWSLEMEWMQRFSSSSSFPYVPEWKGMDPTTESKEEDTQHLHNRNMGHCDGPRYIPLILPAAAAATSSKNEDTETLI